jgi:hypothetical protein
VRGSQLLPGYKMNKRALAKLKRIAKDYDEFQLGEKRTHASMTPSQAKTFRQDESQSHVSTVGLRSFAVGGARLAVADFKAEVVNAAALKFSFLAHWWDIRLMNNFYGLGQNAALILADSQLRGDVTGSSVIAEWLLSHLVQDEGRLYADCCSFTSFILRFYAQVHQRPEVLAKLTAQVPRHPDLHVYAEILKHWDNPDVSVVTPLLERACEYHMAETHRESGYAEFYFVPYELYAVDILVWLNERRKLGLAMPVLEHPLLQLPCNQLPVRDAELAPEDAKLLEQVVAQARKLGLVK